MKKKNKALAFLAKICPERITLNGQSVVVITEFAYKKLIKILESK